MTPDQLYSLKELYVERMIDGMDVTAMQAIVFDNMMGALEELNESETLNEISTFCDDCEVAELVETVCAEV